MLNLEFETRRAADVARIQVIDAHKTYPPEAGCTDWIAEPRGNGISRLWNGRQVMLLALHADLVRLGMPLPRAGRLVGRIAETLALNPDAEKLFIEQRANGALFFTVDNEPSDAARAAGKVHLTLMFELANYRRAVEAAAGAVGDRDE